MDEDQLILFGAYLCVVLVFVSVAVVALTSP